MESLSHFTIEVGTTMSLTSQDWTFVNDGRPKVNPNYLCIIQCTERKISVTANLPQSYQIDIGANYEEAFSQGLQNTSSIAAIGPKLRALGLQTTTQALTAQIWQGSTEFMFSLPLVFQAEEDEQSDILRKLTDLYRLTLPDEAFSNGLLSAPGPRLDPKEILKSVGSAATGVVNSPLSSVANSVQEELSGLYKQLKGFVSGPEEKASSAINSTSSAQTSPSNRGLSNPLLAAIKNNISLTIGNYMKLDSVVITNVSQNHMVQPLVSGTMSRVEVTVGFKTFFTPTQKDIPNIFLGLRWSPDRKGL